MTGAAWTLDGYGIERLLGFGSTGEVWLAHELATGDVVALKRLRQHAAGAGQASPERLRREAALLSTLRHPHVLPLRGVMPVADGLVLVLDYAGGGTVARLLASRDKLGAGELVTTAGPLADALAAVHRQGLVHGDVTPANILYTVDGRPLLADLGVARMVGEVGRPVDGTAGYIDPAVLAGAEPTAASDVYGLAAVCYRGLTGMAPIAGSVKSRWRRPPRTALRELAPDAPAALVEAIEAALSPLPRSRPDAATLAVRLAAACPAVAVQLSATGSTATRPAVAWDGPPGADELPTNAIRPAISAGVVAPADGRAARRRAGLRGYHPGLGQGVKPPADASIRSRPRPRRRLLATTAPVVLAIVLLGGWWYARPAGTAIGLPSVAPPTAASPTATSPAAPQPTTASTPAPAPREWRTVLAGLDGRRSAAFADGNPAILTEVYVEGTAPYAADLAALRHLVDDGDRARPVRHELRQVQLLSGAADRVRLELTDEMPAYDVVDATGSVVGSHPGRGPMSWQVVLAAVPDGWRILSVDVI